MSENAKKFIQNSRLVLTVFVVEKTTWYGKSDMG